MTGQKAVGGAALVVGAIAAYIGVELGLEYFVPGFLLMLGGLAVIES